MEELLKILRKATEELKSSIVQIELNELVSHHDKSGKDLSLEVTIKQFGNVKVKMYKEHRHSRPHVHIDIGNEYSSASIAIDDRAFLKGERSLKKSIRIVVLEWIEKNKATLLEVWDKLQNGEEYDLSPLT